MFGIGSRTFYAIWGSLMFNFESKRDRDYFVAHAEGSRIMPSCEYYKIQGSSLHAIKVPASYRLGADKDRKHRINRWYYADK